MPRLRFVSLLLVALFALPAKGATALENWTVGDRKPARSGMVRIPSGTHRPLYGRTTDAPMRVRAFDLDRDPVTRGEVLPFVRAHSEWRRSVVDESVVERTGYLADWSADLDAGNGADLRRPVTGVSWFAARAYCEARGKRLPTLDEWEYVAAANERDRDAARSPAFVQRLVAIYASRTARRRTVNDATSNLYGVRGLHDLGWEWVDDFNASSPAHRTHVHQDQHDLSCAGAAIGASDASNYPAFLRYAVRAGATARTTLSSMGFRCAV
jgi:formylglycine-generating enzyme